MRPRVPLMPLMMLALAALPAWAGRGAPCDSCQSCTEALAKPGAKVAQSGPIASPGGVCVVIKGAGATFDGGRHAIQGAAEAVRIEGADAFVKHVRVQGGARGVVVLGGDAVVLDLQTEGVTTGVDVQRAGGFRLVRSTLKGGDVGVAFGPAPGGVCPAEARLRSPSAVLRRVEITGAGVGVQACEAAPVITDSTLRGNGVGLLQGAADTLPNVRGAGAGAPWDPCACGASLDGVRPGTTLFYSSGCGGCLVHEGFLPEVRARGHDVRLRANKDDKPAQAAFDAYTRRCAPEIMDAIGLPGCVPNYACVADGAVAKRRGDADRLVFDARLSSADQVSDFAARCASTAQTHFADGTCPAHALWGTTLCGNEKDVVSARPIAGEGNRCGAVTGAGDATGCGPCDGATAPAAKPAAPTPTAPKPATPEPATPVATEPAAAPTSSPAASSASASAPAAAEGQATVPWWIPAGAFGVAALLGLVIVRRRR